MAQNYERIALDQNWQLRAQEFPEAHAIPTKVPGMVQEELIRSGLLPDPYYGTNEDQAQWVGERNWEYLLDWEVPTLDSNRTYQLDFRGLDTYAQVYLNDSLILTADNMFRSWQVPVTALLRAGTNQLRVAFTAPLQALRAEIEAFPYPLHKTSVNDTGEPRLANFARKAQFQFGWDWGLRLVTIGIWRPVFLESWEHACIEDVQYYTASITPEVAKVRVAVQLNRTTPGQYELRVRGVENGQFYAKRPLMADEQVVNFDFTIDRPRRWWPNGHGEAYRYHLVCELWRDGELIATHERKIGLRTVELVQQDDAYGISFFFKINGRAIFTKGASYIPQDAVLTRITPEQKTTLLQQCQAAHFNLVRVWGGGIYEDEHFYDQCDSLGLMVWQDFMFACAAYPSFPAFADNVVAEVRENIRRLRNHPSIIQWCGNNEVFLAMKNWGWQLKYGIHGKNNDAMFQSYDDLFQNLIPGILAEEDPDRPYSHTTPTSSWHKAADMGRGSLHYWGVWHGPDDFSGYETTVGRYMNEYGFQSFPDMETIASFADSSEWSLDSPVMAHHQKSYIGNGLIGKFTKKYGQPATNFPDFVYQSQMVQYEGIRRAILSHRLRWGYCMGTTFWQLNDCWPAPSWSAIDYYGRPKVLFQELANLYAPIVAAAVGDARSPELAIISDHPSAAEVMLRWERVDTRNGTRMSSGEKKVVVLQPGTILLEPPLGMVPAKGEFTTIRLEVQGELLSIFKWSGQQEPLRLPQEADWQRFPELVR